MNIEFLSQSIENLKNIGKRRAFLLSKISIFTVKDLLLNFPIKFLQESYDLKLEECLIKVIILKKYQKGKIYCITCKFKENFIELLFFNKTVFNYYLVGKTYKIHGIIEQKDNLYFIKQPKIIYNDSEVIPIYRGSVSSMILHKTVNQIIEQLTWSEKIYNNLTLKQALFNLHNNKDYENSIMCLKTLEANLFLNFFTYEQHDKIIKLNKNILNILPYKLNEDQEKTLNEISENLEQSKPLRHLVLGQVGSGKTLIALGSALLMINAGYNVVFLAPTVTLANQHASWIIPLLEKFDISAAYLTKETKKDKRLEIQNGKYQLIIATHTVLNLEKIENLGLLIIDEMQKFGVLQRAKLLSNAVRKNLLMLSATPIPRSLNITLSKFITCSIIKNSFFSKNIITTSLHNNKINEIIEKLKNMKCKTYWVMPNIDDNINFQGVITRFELLKESFEHVFILYGKMSDKEKIESIENFKKQENAILVSTTVIEIGIDVPSAKIMIIENSQNFGLSQLHQLRGRIGRDGNQAFCILLYNKYSKKFDYMKKYIDGFDIAQKDLELRGSGTLLDTKQHGFFSENGFYFIKDEDSWIFDFAKENKLKKDLTEFMIFVSTTDLLH